MSSYSSIDNWLSHAAKQLADAGVSSARLDAEIILAHTLRKSRTYLHAHGEDELNDRHAEIANARLDLRLDRVPIAYIIGHKEFYGRNFFVSTATLIPRPESESIIETLNEIKPADGSRLVDVGTGSGCLGITAKLEHPNLTVDLLDISTHALNIATKNAKNLKANVSTMQSDLLLDYPYSADIIIANLPYVDKEWEVSPETDHEPSLALFAEDNGLRLIKKLIQQSKNKLNYHGYLIIESDRRQHHIIKNFAQDYDLKHIKDSGLISLFKYDMPPTQT